LLNTIDENTFDENTFYNHLHNEKEKKITLGERQLKAIA
jgi:hypothetical protein